MKLSLRALRNVQIGFKRCHLKQNITCLVSFFDKTQYKRQKLYMSVFSYCGPSHLIQKCVYCRMKNENKEKNISLLHYAGFEKLPKGAVISWQRLDIISFLTKFLIQKLHMETRIPPTHMMRMTTNENSMIIQVKETENMLLLDRHLVLEQDLIV